MALHWGRVALGSRQGEYGEQGDDVVASGRRAHVRGEQARRVLAVCGWG